MRQGALKPLTIIALVFTLLFALWLRMPYVSANLPFFYEEDEGHHFNRLVDMVKEGRFNPEYFHKPSLHFYLRMPAVMLGFLWDVRRGELRSIKEIVTHDKFGLAGYAFTASHPDIVVSARFVSTILSLLIVLVTFFTARKLTNSDTLSICASLLVAASPALIEDSAKIGVDTPTTFFVILAVFLGVSLINAFCTGRFIAFALICGLAVSTKYNSAPIALLPVFLLLLERRLNLGVLIVAIAGPICGFLIGSPFILASLPLFLDQLAYEVWHYGIAGHVGHSAEPGWPQAIFYLNWLCHDAIGWIAIILCLLAIILIVLRRKTSELLVLIFPLLFFVLMSMQRANFTRNLLPILPFIAIMAVMLIRMISVRMKRSPHGLHLAFSFLLLVQPLGLSLSAINKIGQQTDSRQLALSWLAKNAVGDQDVAIQGELLFPKPAVKNLHISPLALEQINVTNLWLLGYDWLAVPYYNTPARIEPAVSFGSEPEKQRIVKDPLINLIKLDKNSLLALNTSVEEISYYPALTVDTELLSQDRSSCYSDNSVGAIWLADSKCWIHTRVAKVVIPTEKLYRFIDPSGKLSFKVQLSTPWPQKVKFYDQSQLTEDQLVQESSLVSGEMTTTELSLAYRQIKEEGGFYIVISDIHSPKQYGLGEDSRRLGLAIERIDVERP